MEKTEQQLMTPLKEKIINYILKFISERDREVLTSDLFEVIMRQFGSELKDNCNDNQFSDEMFAESIIHETYRLYGLTYTEKEDKLIGLTEEGNKAANHPKGILGFLDDKEKKRKRLKHRKSIQFYVIIISSITAIVGAFIDYFKPDTNWANNLSYLAIGILIGIASTRIFRMLADKLGK